MATVGSADPTFPRVLVTRGPDAIAQTVDQDTVVYVGGNASMILLDAVATRLWERLAEPMPLDELCRDLAAEFGVDVDRVAHDLEGPFESLVRSGVLTASVDQPVRV